MTITESQYEIAHSAPPRAIGEHLDAIKKVFTWLRKNQPATADEVQSATALNDSEFAPAWAVLLENGNLSAYPAECGPVLFTFENFQDWVNTARHQFENAGSKAKAARCRDSLGRDCPTGFFFNRAEDEGTFPVTCYEATTEQREAYIKERVAELKEANYEATMPDHSVWQIPVKLIAEHAAKRQGCGIEEVWPTFALDDGTVVDSAQMMPWSDVEVVAKEITGAWPTYDEWWAVAEGRTT